MSKQSTSSVNKILSNNLCSGCGLCASKFNDKISIGFDKAGFLRPHETTALTTEENRELEAFCPGVNIKNSLSLEPGFQNDAIWGIYSQMCTGYATDNESRQLGSSGGVLTALSSYLIGSGTVQAVIQVGASLTQPLLIENKVSTDISSTVENAGSRYAPSATLLGLESALEQYDALAIVAKPCEISAVRQYQKLYPEQGKKIKYLLSFFCAGVPSMRGTEAAIKSLGGEPSEVKSLRYRGDGWPGYFKFTDSTGNEHKMTYNDSWGRILNQYLQFRCKICPDGTGEQADIVCADAWEESQNGYPDFEQRPGRSLIVTRTNKGNALLKQAIENGNVKIEDPSFDVSSLKRIQPYQHARKANVIPRIAAMKMLMMSTPSFEWGSLMRASGKATKKENIRNFLGMTKRLFKVSRTKV